MRPEDYCFSSARNYAELENELEVILLELLNAYWNGHGKHFRANDTGYAVIAKSH